jgi:hypothetical protein
MRARLLFTYPVGSLPDGAQIPAAPALLIEDKNVGLFTSDWVRVFPRLTLDMLTERDVREALQLDENIAVHLSEARLLPEASLYSATVSEWRQAWWREMARALSAHLSLAKAS